MNIDEIKNKKEEKKKRGRRPKDEKLKYELNTEQTKFVVDLSKDKEELVMVQQMLVEANTKNYGGIISFKDIALYSFNKLGTKDIDKLQENSLSEMEKVERSFLEYNSKHGLNLNLGEYLLKKLNLN